MGGGEWANCIPVSERARGMGLRGCISCLLPGRKPPTKTLMSNVSDDNANPTPLSRSFHDHRVCSNSKTSEEEFSSFERTRIRDKESFYQNFLGRNLKIERTGEEGDTGREESNSEENGLVYLKILPRAPMPRLGRGLDETLSIFAPARSPPPPVSPRPAPRHVPSVARTTLPVSANRPEPPPGATLPPGRTPPSLENGERTRSLPRPRTGARTRRSGRVAATRVRVGRQDEYFLILPLLNFTIPPDTTRFVAMATPPKYPVKR